MSLVANFADKAARSLGNKFSERAAIQANASTDGEVFEQYGLDSATRLAALQNKVDGVGASSTNRHVAALAERMGLGSAAENKKREDEESRSRILRNVSEEIRKKLDERLGELRDLSERYGRNIDARNLVLDMLRRGEDPFAKDAMGNYVHHELLFNEDQANYSYRDVQGMEKLSLGKREIAAERSVQNATEARRKVDELAEEYMHAEKQPNYDLEALKKRDEEISRTHIIQIQDVEIDDLVDAPALESSTELQTQPVIMSDPKI